MKRRDVIKNSLKAAGSAALAPSMWSLLQSCQSQSRLEWKPKFLSPDQAQFVRRIVDLWLPQTETPGALDVNVDIFIDLVFAKLYDEDAQASVINEIEAFDASCQEQFGDSFVALDKADAMGTMKQYETTSGKFNPGVWGTTVGDQEPIGFYRQLKSMALWAYFTSEEIGKNVLRYDPIPGVYQGCIPYSEGEKRWSL